MARLTITLSDDLHLALKEAAVRRGRTPGELIEECLEFYGIKPLERAETLVAKAREAAALSESEALEIAVAETRLHRRS
jgi:hypothetical protein